MIVALAVTSVAAGVIVTLFSQSMALGNSSCNEGTAASIAEARIIDLKVNPAAYVWPNANALSPGQLLEIGVRNEEPAVAGYLSEPPETTLTYQKGAERVKSYYEGFKWKAYVRLPNADAAYVEVVVSVQWSEAQRARSLSFTSSLPRSFVEEAA